ncbi:hypothetical protein DFS34DRAFT_595282 [Phlyctochytrium arcticum]|nr:hypothetical protein DFS34DRAFT_595282 [Phlyctochytrium arcticum]
MNIPPAPNRAPPQRPPPSPASVKKSTSESHLLPSPSDYLPPCRTNSHLLPNPSEDLSRATSEDGLLMSRSTSGNGNQLDVLTLRQRGTSGTDNISSSGAGSSELARLRSKLAAIQARNNRWIKIFAIIMIVGVVDLCIMDVLWILSRKWEKQILEAGGTV